METTGVLRDPFLIQKSSNEILNILYVFQIFCYLCHCTLTIGCVGRSRGVSD